MKNDGDHSAQTAADVMTRGSACASTAHPLATRAALEILAAGGSAIDAALAAQAVICVVMPQAAGLGGDLLMLVHDRAQGLIAVNGTGKSASLWSPPNTGPGASVTVPGIVGGWASAHAHGGFLSIRRILEPALQIATDGYLVDAALAQARDTQRERLIAHGAHPWALMTTEVGKLWKQPELAALLELVGTNGTEGFYGSRSAGAITRAAAQYGGALTASDFDLHSCSSTAAVSTAWGTGMISVQPPASQGLLLSMVTRWLDSHSKLFETPSSSENLVADGALDHILIEVTEAAFQHRDQISSRNIALLDEVLEVNTSVAGNRGGPRSYLHTAGVAVTDSRGMTVSSLVSVFDDFGSAIFVPELGIVLNNRADGFTAGDNAYAPNAYPVHTLAPAIVIDQVGNSLALATPGADGQVQTLAQVVAKMRFGAESLSAAIMTPRWRSENGRLLIEDSHPQITELRARGHRVVPTPYGEDVFGAVVAAGLDSLGSFAAADVRRGVSVGAL